MIDPNLLFALISFYFVMYVTPGPNNAMVLASGLKFGFVKTIPHMSGITIGHVLQLILVCLGLGKIFQIFPQLQNILKILCSLYLLYLGYKIVGSFSKIKEDNSRPLKFHEAALFQIVNPKAWTIALTVVSAFFPTEENFYIATFFLTSTAALICFPSICIWAIFGNSLRLFINNRKTKKIIEYILAILLVITATYILIK